MDEQVAVAFIRGDEAVALLVVEPLHGTGRHLAPFPLRHALLGARRQTEPTACAFDSAGPRSDPRRKTYHHPTPEGQPAVARFRGSSGLRTSASQLCRNGLELCRLCGARARRELERIVLVPRDHVDVEMEDGLPGR